MRLGVLPVGAAEGLGQLHAGRVLVRGRSAAVLGAPSLEYTRIDLSDVPEARVADEVVVIGQQGDAEVRPRWPPATVCRSINWPRSSGRGSSGPGCPARPERRARRDGRQGDDGRMRVPSGCVRVPCFQSLGDTARETRRDL
jgi:hypothetical protein